MSLVPVIRRRGFTLIELLVVISIIALLVAILLPALKKARETALQSACLSNQRQLAIATFAYHADNGALPPASKDDDYNNAGFGSPWYTMAVLGPYLGQDIPKTPRLGGGSTGPKIAPRGTVAACPADAVYSTQPLNSWIAYNGKMCTEYMSMLDLPFKSTPYWSGPPIDKVGTAPSKLVLFEDGRGFSFLYVAFVSSPNAPIDNVATSSGAPDKRHDGGVNYAFLDGHAAHFGDVYKAYAIDKKLTQFSNIR